MKRIIIDGDEYDYYIQPDGVVLNKKLKVMKAYIHNGYKMFALCKNGKYKKIGLHQLLAISFIENRHNYKIVRHLDDNRLNNDLQNLAWGTQKMNIEDAIKNGRMPLGSNRAHSVLSDEQVIDIFINKQAKTTAELANIYNVSSGNISNIQNRKRWRHITNGLVAKFRPYKNGKGLYAVS